MGTGRRAGWGRRGRMSVLCCACLVAIYSVIVKALCFPGHSMWKMARVGALYKSSVVVVVVVVV